jgi:hypothetical protein
MGYQNSVDHHTGLLPTSLGNGKTTSGGRTTLFPSEYHRVLHMVHNVASGNKPFGLLSTVAARSQPAVAEFVLPSTPAWCNTRDVRDPPTGAMPVPATGANSLKRRPHEFHCVI